MHRFDGLWRQGGHIVLFSCDTGQKGKATWLTGEKHRQGIP